MQTEAFVECRLRRQFRGVTACRAAAWKVVAWVEEGEAAADEADEAAELVRRERGEEVWPVISEIAPMKT